MARYLSRAVSRGLSRDSAAKLSQNHSIQDSAALPSAWSRPYSLLSEVQDNEATDFFTAQIEDLTLYNSLASPSRAERKFEVQGEKKLEGYHRSSGKELALVLATLENITQNSMSLPDYIIVLCCSVLSRVTSDTVKDVKKARSLINVFLPALVPRYPFSTKYLELYSNTGIFRFFTENGTEVLKKNISFDSNYRVLSEKRLSPFSSCLIVLKYRRILRGNKDWWQDVEDVGAAWRGWYQIIRPTSSSMINEKFKTRYEALDATSGQRSLDDFLGSDGQILDTSLSDLLATMHESERSCFLLPLANPSNSTEDYLGVSIEVLRKKIVITNGNNLFTTDIALDRFFTVSRYSNFAHADDQFLVVEFDAQQVMLGPMTLDAQPRFQQESSVMITIRFRAGEVDGADNHLADPGGQSSVNIHGPIYESFIKLPPIWKWLVMVTPAEVDIKYTIFNSRGKLEACHHLLWSAIWRGDEDQEGSTASNVLSVIPASNSPGPREIKTGPLSTLRKLLKLALVDLKMEIALVAHAVVAGHESRVHRPEASLCAAAIIRRGMPILEKARTINEEFGEASENPELTSTGSVKTRTRYICETVSNEEVFNKATAGKQQTRENRDRKNNADLLKDIFDTVLGGNYYFTKSLATLCNGLNTRSTFVTRPLRLVNVNRLDPANLSNHFGECDGYYKRTLLGKGGILYTVALVSGFSNWTRGCAHRYFVKHNENVVIEMGSDHIFTGPSPFFACLKSGAKSANDIVRISKNDIWNYNGFDLHWSLPCLYRMVETEINQANSENTLFSLDFTTMWPSLSIHSMGAQMCGTVAQELIQALPRRRPTQSMHAWVKEFATYVLHGNMFLSRRGLICTSVFGRPILLMPLRGELTTASAGMVVRGLGAMLSGDSNDKTRTATIAAASFEHELSSIISGKDLVPQGIVQEFLKTAVRDFRNTTCTELMQTRSYLLVNADPQLHGPKTPQELIKMLCVDHDFGRPGLWAMLYPTLFTEEVKNLRLGETNIESLALCAWSYLILTSKFGRHRDMSKKSGWSVGLIPANFDPQYMASLEERAPAQSLMGSRTVSGIMSTTQVSDISDWDHLIIERNRHELFDVLLALVMIEAEKQSGDPILVYFANDEGVNSDVQRGGGELNSEQTLIRNRLARLLSLSFSTYMAPTLLNLLNTFGVEPEYEKTILDNCCQIVSGGSYLAMNSSKKLKILGWIGFIRGTSFEPIHKNWLDQGGNKIDLRSSTPSCSEQLKVVMAVAGQVNHTIFRAQMDIDRGAYSEVQIGDQVNNLEEAVDAVAASFFEAIIPANVLSLYVDLLRKICKHRRTLLWPNTIHRGKTKTMGEASPSTELAKLGKFAKDSEYLETVNAQIPYGNTNPISAIHLTMSSLCRLLETGSFGASALWQSVSLIFDHLLTDGDLTQPEPISLRLIGLLVIPLRLLSAYHHLHSQPGPALAADNLGRFTRALLPAYLRCNMINDLNLANPDLTNLAFLLKLPIGPASLKPISDLSENLNDFKSWPGLEMQAHSSLLAESGSIDKNYVASILETNYLSEATLEAWVRCALYLIHHQPPILNFSVTPSCGSLPSPSVESFSSLIRQVLSKTTLYSAGLNGASGCLGLGGVPRFLPYDPTMACSEPKLMKMNDLCRNDGTEIWLSMACQGIFDGGMNQSLGKILKIDCAEKHSVCLTETGQLLVFGSTQSGQLGFSFANQNSSVLPSGLVRANYGIRRMLDQTKNIHKKDRIKCLRHILRSLVASPETDCSKARQVIHTPLLLTLSENGIPTQISNICCGAMFTLCVAQPSKTLVIFWNEDSIEMEFEDEHVPDERCEKGIEQSARERPGSTEGPSPRSIHPVYTDSTVISISAGVSHWVAVMEDGFMLIGGENSAYQLGPWRPLSPKTLESMCSLLDIYRLDCYIANNDLVAPPSLADLINFAALSGSPTLQTYPGGDACLFRVAHKSNRLIMIVGRPFKNIDTNIGPSATPSPKSSRQNMNVGCLKDFHAAKFVAADCGETHTICLIDDTCTKQRYAISWGSNDLNQQFPLAKPVHCTTGTEVTPGVIPVGKEFKYVLAGAASSAVGNKERGIWCGTECNGHLGLSDADDEYNLCLEPASLSVNLSRFNLASVREIEVGRYQLYGPKVLGNFLAPRFLEEGVIRAWRERESRIKRSSNDRILLPWACRSLSFGTDHIVCIVTPRPTFKDSQCQRYLRELCFNINARIGRKYRNLEDAIINFMPNGGPVRVLKGPPPSAPASEPCDLNFVIPPESLELPFTKKGDNSPREEIGVNTKWLQKGIEGVSKFVDSFLTNILKEATTTDADETANWPPTQVERRSTIATTYEKPRSVAKRMPSSTGQMKERRPPEHWQRGQIQQPAPPIPLRQEASPARQPPTRVREPAPLRRHPAAAPPLMMQPYPLNLPSLPRQPVDPPPRPPRRVYTTESTMAAAAAQSQFYEEQLYTPLRSTPLRSTPLMNQGQGQVQRQLFFTPQMEQRQPPPQYQPPLQPFLYGHSRQSSRNGADFGLRQTTTSQMTNPNLAAQYGVWLPPSEENYPPNVPAGRPIIHSPAAAASYIRGNSPKDWPGGPMLSNADLMARAELAARARLHRNQQF